MNQQQSTGGRSCWNQTTSEVWLLEYFHVLAYFGIPIFQPGIVEFKISFNIQTFLNLFWQLTLCCISSVFSRVHVPLHLHVRCVHHHVHSNHRYVHAQHVHRHVLHDLLPSKAEVFCKLMIYIWLYVSLFISTSGLKHFFLMIRAREYLGSVKCTLTSLRSTLLHWDGIHIWTIWRCLIFTKHLR